jgi:hypothetical protein
MPRKSQEEARLRELVASIDAALAGQPSVIRLDPQDHAGRIRLIMQRRQLTELLDPPAKKGRPPPAWQIWDQAQLFAMLADEVRKIGTRGALTAVVRRFSRTHGLTAKGEKSLRVRLHAYLRRTRAGPEV